MRHAGYKMAEPLASRSALILEHGCQLACPERSPKKRSSSSSPKCLTCRPSSASPKRKKIPRIPTYKLNCPGPQNATLVRPSGYLRIQPLGMPYDAEGYQTDLSNVLGPVVRAQAQSEEVTSEEA